MARPIARWLFRLSGRLPCRLIKIEGSPYLERYWLGRGMGVTAYLHRFVGRDGDRNLHDHPWRWSLSIVLTGGYLEARLRWFDPSLTTGWNERVRRIGGWRRLNWIGCGDFHQIVRVDPETWTLFMHGPRVKGWGFLSSGQNLDEHDPAYVSYDGYPPPASFDWQHASPIGREAGREPLGGALMPRRARTFHEAFAEGWEPGAEACLSCPLPDCVEITHPDCPRYRNKNRPAAARQAVKRDRAMTLSRVADKHCRSHA